MEEWRPADDVRRLPRIVAARAHEPAESILFRLAVANGYPSISALIRGTPNLDMNSVGSRFSRNKFVALAARLGGLPEDRIEAVTPYRNSSGTTIYGQHFRKIRPVGKARVCPACLTDDTQQIEGQVTLRPYRRNWWEVQNIGTCPFHAVRLVDACPSCCTQLRLTDSPTSCKCHPRADIRNAAWETVGSEHLSHDRWLLGRLGGCDPVEHGLLDTLPMDVGSRLCLIVGSFIESDCATVKRISNPSYSADLRSAGWRCLNGWPHAFDRFLDKLAQSVPSASKQGAKINRYRGLYGILQAESAPELEVVFEAIRRHIGKKQLVSPSTRVFGQSLSLGEKIALAAAAKLAGCGEVTFLKVARALELPQPPQSKASTAVAYTNQVEPVKAFLEDSMESVDIWRATGCEPKLVSRLIDAGVLRLKLAGKISVSNLVDRNDAERLIQAVSVPLQEMDDINPQHITVRQAARLLWRGEVTMLRGLVSGVLTPIGRLPGSTGFKSMIFVRDELFEAACQLTGLSPSARVVDERGWKQGTIIYLQKVGLVGYGPKAGYVQVSDVKEFASRYVGLEEMLQWEGAPKTKRRLKGLLASKRVAPAVPLAARVTPFWPRERAKRALRAHSAKQ